MITPCPLSCWDHFWPAQLCSTTFNTPNITYSWLPVVCLPDKHSCIIQDFSFHNQNCEDILVQFSVWSQIKHWRLYKMDSKRHPCDILNNGVHRKCTTTCEVKFIFVLSELCACISELCFSGVLLILNWSDWRITLLTDVIGLLSVLCAF